MFNATVKLLTHVTFFTNLRFFSSSTKFDSGSGWPSFFQASGANGTDDSTSNIVRLEDDSLGMKRIEIRCKQVSFLVLSVMFVVSVACFAGVSKLTGNGKPLKPRLAKQRGTSNKSNKEISYCNWQTPVGVSYVTLTGNRRHHAAYSIGSKKLFKLQQDWDG